LAEQIVVEDSLLAIFVRDQAMSGVPLPELAGKYRPAETELKAKYKYLGRVGATELDSAVYREAMLVPVGSLIEPRRTENGFLILKVLERQQQFSVVQARGKIMSILKAQYERDAVDQFTRRLIQRYHVTFPNQPPKFHLKPISLRSVPARS